eukprot:1247608-Prymnesium_polylepis.1
MGALHNMRARAASSPVRRGVQQQRFLPRSFFAFHASARLCFQTPGQTLPLPLPTFVSNDGNRHAKLQGQEHGRAPRR